MFKEFKDFIMTGNVIDLAVAVILAGAIGYELSELIFIYIGEIGIISILIFGLFSFLVIRMKITPEKIYES